MLNQVLHSVYVIIKALVSIYFFVLYYCIHVGKNNRNNFLHSFKRGSCMVWEINMGVCPRLEFDNIIFINCLGYDFYIYGAFEFLCNYIANL